MKRTIVKSISLILAVLVVVYFVTNYAGSAKSEILAMLHIPGSSVKGTSTQKAQEISSEISSDVGSHIDSVRDYVLGVSVGDAIHGLSRLQKIPQDMRFLQEYVKEQAGNMLQSRK